MPLPMPRAVPELGFYYHYKHDPAGAVENYAYEVVGVGFHTEDDVRPGEAHFLIYRPLYSAAVFTASHELNIPCYDARPLEMWMENVEYKGETTPRFKKITDQEVIAKLEAKRAEMYGV
jgi:hypothetical protein